MVLHQPSETVRRGGSQTRPWPPGPAPTAALAAEDPFTPEDMIASWYGQYTGYSNDDPVERYLDMTIHSCGLTGTFYGNAKVTTLPDQGYDAQWFSYEFSGAVNFATGKFHMAGTNLLGHSPNVNWNMSSFEGTLERTGAGDLVITGITQNKFKLPFLLSRISSWARDEITEANMLGLIPEELEGADLSKPATQAEFTAVAVRLFESMAPYALEGVEIPFLDVEGHPYLDSIAKAYAASFTTGTGATTFDPDDSITREQLATMLYRVIKKVVYRNWTLSQDSQFPLIHPPIDHFKDHSSISPFALEAVYFMASSGVVNGVGDGLFAPRATTPQEEAAHYAIATREQAIIMALRAVKRAEQWKAPMP